VNAGRDFSDNSILMISFATMRSPRIMILFLFELVATFAKFGPYASQGIACQQCHMPDRRHLASEKPIIRRSAASFPYRPFRRSFVALLIGFIWAAITGTIGAVAARFVAAPTPGGVSPANWTDLGTLKDIPDAKPTKRDVVIQQDSGWARFNSLRSVWIVRRGQSATVFSATCPHLGCTVDASANEFACPCHGSSWNLNGEKLGGPTPRALDVLESHVDSDMLKVRYQDFKQGTAEKESV